MFRVIELAEAIEGERVVRGIANPRAEMVV
jgi:hypothetical protein